MNTRSKKTSAFAASPRQSSHSQRKTAGRIVFLLAMIFFLSAAKAPAEILDLGRLPNGDLYSTAMDVSANGQVVVGYTTPPYDPTSSISDPIIHHAFLWTPSGGMTSLGALNGGSWSRAHATSADGSVVVGEAADGLAANATRAFRWTEAAGMVNLGVLNEGRYSKAYGVSDDGNVVVGYSEISTNFSIRAFRWTQATGMVSLGVINNGNSSEAMEASADGGVVVGYAADGAANNADRAFRWTQDGGMVNLGVINGGNVSRAFDVSADGKVVVGESTYNTDAIDAYKSADYRGFRWTQTTGMITVEQWLAANGVSVGPEMTTSRASSVSADGNTVAGYLTNGHAYLARVVSQDAPNPGGMVDLVNFNNSFYEARSLPALLLNGADLVIHGSHGSPMRGVLQPGQSSVWTTGDLGVGNHASHFDDQQAAGEFGYSRAIAEGLQWKLAIGGSHDRNDLEQGGDYRIQGVYLTPEVIYNFYGNFYASLTGYYQDGSTDFRRGYLNAGTQVFSVADDIDSQTLAARLRLDWLNAFNLGNAEFSPYVSATVVQTSIDGFTETGGGFPARWDSRNETETTFRAGMDAAVPITDSITLLGRMEAGLRADDEGADSIAHVLGLYDLNLPGLSYRRSWLRGGAGFEIQWGPGSFSTMVNAVTDGGSPASHWLTASYRVTF
jgi:probable HAF family extracellular repeat protein